MRLSSFGIFLQKKKWSKTSLSLFVGLSLIPSLAKILCWSSFKGFCAFISHLVRLGV